MQLNLCYLFWTHNIMYQLNCVEWQDVVIYSKIIGTLVPENVKLT